MRVFLKMIIYFLPPLLVTIFLYWPVYRSIGLQNSESREEAVSQKLNFSLDENLLGIFGISLPINRHRLCLKNNNQVYLIHTDSPLFRTPDISQTKEARDARAGAMAVDLSYSDGSKDEIYREIGQSIKCEDLITKKLQNLASSTVLYHHMALVNKTEIDLGASGHLISIRKIANSFVYTGSPWSFFSSKVFIIANWKYFLATFTVFSYFWYKFIKRKRKAIS